MSENTPTIDDPDDGRPAPAVRGRCIQCGDALYSEDKDGVCYCCDAPDDPLSVDGMGDDDAYPTPREVSGG